MPFDGAGAATGSGADYSDVGRADAYHTLAVRAGAEDTCGSLPSP